MKRLTEEEKDEIKKLLLWKPIRKIGDDTLEVGSRYDRDKKILRLGGNEGCGGCSAGNYDLTELNDTSETHQGGYNWISHAVVTNVEFEEPDDDKWGDKTGCYRIFVYTENKKIKLAEFEGSDGNGYYGTGYWIEVYE